MIFKKKDYDKEEKELQKKYDAYAYMHDWICPVCHKSHTKPHFAKPGQIDLKKEPNQPGRIKNNAEREKNDYCDAETGPVLDKDGRLNPIFCPHCGYLNDIIRVEKRSKKKKND